MKWLWQRKEIRSDADYTLKLVDISHRFVTPIVTYSYDIYVSELKAVVGQVEYREETDPLDLEYYGQVGYQIYDAYRGHHFAYYACLELFKILESKGIKEILITCNPDNEPSKKTILKLGGEFLRQVDVIQSHPLYKFEKQKEVYRITLP